MDKKIKKLSYRAVLAEKRLYNAVVDLNNFMNECKCDSSTKHIFRNVIRHDNPYIFCLNCGGYIEP